MYKLQIENLFFTKSLYFYRDGGFLNRDSIIDDILKSSTINCVKDKDGNPEPYILNIFRKENEKIPNLKFSIRIFLTEKPVYFLKTTSQHANYEERDYINSLKDKIYAYIVIIEYKDYLCILKKSCANISFSLEKANLCLIDLYSLGHVLPEDVEYKKMAFRTITSSNHDVYSKVYYANNLQGALSLHSAGRSILSGLQISKNGKITSLTSTGRFTENSHRNKFEDLLNWVKVQVENIDNHKNSINPFLSNFAKKIELNNLPKEVIPNSLMIESLRLSELIQKRNSDIFYKEDNGTFTALDNLQKDKLFSKIENIFHIESGCSIKKTYTIIRGKINRNTKDRININKKSITFSIALLKNMYIDENGEKINLNKFIIEHKLYSITFTNFKYMYFMGACFEDTSGTTEVSQILNILQPISNMSQITSEKGTEFLRSNSVNFHKTSMFNLIENIHKKSEKDDYILCDDLGNEWADHITFNSRLSRICFIHSKHGKKSKSASNLHDVVGQGIKNLGNMFFDTNQIWNMKFMNNQQKNFFSFYNLDKKNTKINRLRYGDSNPKIIQDYLDNLLEKRDLYRQCILSCSFISKNAVKFRI